MMKKTFGTSMDQHKEPRQRVRVLESRALRFAIPALSALTNRTSGAGLSVPAEDESDSLTKATEKRYLGGSDAISLPKQRRKTLPQWYMKAMTETEQTGDTHTHAHMTERCQTPIAKSFVYRSWNVVHFYKWRVMPNCIP